MRAKIYKKGAKQRDLGSVYVVDGDLEKALKHLDRQMSNSKVFKTIKVRKQHPAPADRRRRKRKIATACALAPKKGGVSA